MAMNPTWQSAARLAAFAFLAQETKGGELPVSRDALTSFTYDGRSMALAGARGIWKPAVLDLPISITTKAPIVGVEPPYPDEITPDGRLLYRYEGTDPKLWTNRGMRQLMHDGQPLIYLRGIVPGLYYAEGALIVEDEPSRLTVTVFTSPLDAVSAGLPLEMSVAAQRHYMATVKRRVDQQSFRHAVLNAYRNQCSVCRLRHPELLDAAHIIPFSDGGQAAVPNGLSMCKIHHAAFDTNILGVHPDSLKVEVRADILQEVDGPMLQHGLKDMHGERLLVPRSDALRPAAASLVARYSAFAGS